MAELETPQLNEHDYFILCSKCGKMLIYNNVEVQTKEHLADSIVQVERYVHCPVCNSRFIIREKQFRETIL